LEKTLFAKQDGDRFFAFASGCDEWSTGTKDYLVPWAECKAWEEL